MFRRTHLALTVGALAALSTVAALQAQDSTMMMKQDSATMVHHEMMMTPMGGQHGRFAGAHDHQVSGSFSVTEQDGRQVLTLGKDFSLDGAPDPYIVLSANEMGSGAGTLNLGPLKSKRGSASFALPAGTDLAKYSRVLVWCRKYNVTLGEADLAATDKMMHN
jgi:hypothetical protein